MGTASLISPSGVPGEAVAGQAAGGAVHLLFGSASFPVDGGLSLQGNGGISSSPRLGDRFGATLAAGHIDVDAYADLVVGVPGEEAAGALESGAIHLLYGQSNGSFAGGALHHPDGRRVSGSAEVGARFGAALAIGQLNLDAPGEIIVGTPGLTATAPDSRGGFIVLLGNDFQ